MSLKTAYCDFCDLLKNKKNLIIFENERIFAIEDIDPATSKRHILVCPIIHIENTNHLTMDNLDLLDEIHNTTLSILQSSHPNQEYRFGYHTPPHLSIDHLHYHGIVLPIKDQFFSLVKFGKLLTSYQDIKLKISDQANK